MLSTPHESLSKGLLRAFGLAAVGALSAGLLFVSAIFLEKAGAPLSWLGTAFGFAALVIIPCTAIVFTVSAWKAAKHSNRPLITLGVRAGAFALSVVVANAILAWPTIYLAMYASDGGSPWRSVETAIAGILFAVLYYGLMAVNFVVVPAFILWTTLQLAKISKAYGKLWQYIAKVAVALVVVLILAWGGSMLWSSIIQSRNMAKQEAQITAATKKVTQGMATDEDCNLINIGQPMPSNVQNQCWKAKDGTCVQCTAGELMQLQDKLRISMKGMQDPNKKEIDICEGYLRQHAENNNVDPWPYIDQNRAFVYTCVDAEIHKRDTEVPTLESIKPRTEFYWGEASRICIAQLEGTVQFKNPEQPWTDPQVSACAKQFMIRQEEEQTAKRREENRKLDKLPIFQDRCEHKVTKNNRDEAHYIYVQKHQADIDRCVDEMVQKNKADPDWFVR